MKKRRHELIIKAIENKDIATQEELLLALREDGLDVTQATVSRDIKELGLVKSMGKNGKRKTVFLRLIYNIICNKGFMCILKFIKFEYFQKAVFNENCFYTLFMRTTHRFLHTIF